MAKKTVTKKETTNDSDGLVRVRSLKKDIAMARLDLMTGKLKDTSVLRKKRKEVARLLTAAKIKNEKNA